MLSVSSTYSNPTGATNDSIYADAWGGEQPTLPNYRECVGPDNFSGGKVGGTVNTTYTVKILAMSGAATASTLILDFSGNSYHYDSAPNHHHGAAPATHLTKLADKSSTLVGTNGPTRCASPTGDGPLHAHGIRGHAPDLAGSRPTSQLLGLHGAAVGNPTQAGGTLRWMGSFSIRRAVAQPPLHQCRCRTRPASTPTAPSRASTTRRSTRRRTRRQRAGRRLRDRLHAAVHQARQELHSPRQLHERRAAPAST